MIQRLEETACEENRHVMFVAAQLGLVWSFGMRDLVEENPDIIRNTDENTRLYPFMLMASSHHSDLNTIYNMIKTAPDVVQSYHWLCS